MNLSNHSIFMHFKFANLLPVATAAVLAAGAALSQVPGRTDQVQRSEDDILLREIHGDDFGALDSACQLLTSTFRDSAAAGKSEKNAFEAHLEFQLFKAYELAKKTTGYSKLLKSLDGVAQNSMGAQTRGILNYMIGRCAYHLNQLDRVDQCTRDLGYITNWILIGPFDNERGGGFTQSLDPERDFVPELSVSGKERDVQWRDLPVAMPHLGQIVLSGMMRPHEQALCYLRTTVTLQESQKIELRVSSSEAVRIWWDGKLLLDKNVRRDISFDQDIITIDGEKGTHEILAKVCTQEGQWAFSCRLTDEFGAPIKNVVAAPRQVSTLRGSNKSQDSTTPMNGDSAGHADSIAYFEKIVGRESGKAESAPANVPEESQDSKLRRAGAAFRLAYLLRLRNSHDRASHPDREPAQLATQLAPTNGAYHVLYANTLRQVTAAAEEKELNPFRRQMETAFEIDKNNFTAAVALAKHYEETLHIVELQRQWIERARKIAPANLSGLMTHAEFLRRQGLASEGELLLKNAAKLPNAQEYAPLLELLGSSASDRGKTLEAEKHYRAAMALDVVGSDSAFEGLRQIFVSQGRFDEYGRILDENQKLHPFQTNSIVAKAELSQARKNLTEMNQLFSDATSLCPEDASLYATIAHARNRMGDREGTIQALERCVLLDPKDRVQRRYLEFLKSSVKPFEDPFRKDGLDLLKGSKESIAAKDEPYEVLAFQIVYNINPDGAVHRYEHIVARILNEEGSKRLDTYGVRYDPEEEQVRIRCARVYRKNGTVDEAPIPPGASWVKFPPVGPGDVIDVELRVDTIKLGVFGNYFGSRHLFHALNLASTQVSEQIYLAPPDRELHFTERNGAPKPTVETSADGKLKIYRFVMNDLRRPDLESSMPEALEFAPSISVSTYGAWTQFAGWWWNLIEKECQSSPAIKDKVAQLIAGKTTRAEKIRAIYDFVITDVRYNAWEFGVHGYRPYQAATIFDRQYGDCKDKAILIKTMLGEAGIEAYPVLIYADESRPVEDLTLPMVGLFNHCIAYVPASGTEPEMFLDGTATNHPMGTLPEMDHGADVVVIKNGEPVMKRVPYPDVQINRDSTEIRLEVQADGSAKGTILLKPKGNFDVNIREFFSNEKGAQKENLERYLSARFGRTKVMDMTTSNLLDLGAPVQIEATIELEKFAKSRGTDLVLPVLPTPRGLLRHAPETKRNFDLLLGSPDSDEYTITYQLASGLTVKSLPEKQGNASDFGSYSVELEQTGQTIRIHSQSTLLKPRVAPKEYESFREFARKMDESQAREIVLVTKN